MYDISGKDLIADWLEFSRNKGTLFLYDYDLSKFKKLVKDTCLYFQQLNNLDSINMSNGDINFHTCLRIISVLNYYSSNKSVSADCDYDNYEDLKNHPQAKLQIAVKATQLIAEAIIFAVSQIPNTRLSNTLGVIYNGFTTYYDIETENIEDIIRAVADNPYSNY